MNKTAKAGSNKSFSFEPVQGFATGAGMDDNCNTRRQPVNPDEESQDFLRLHF